jgi:RNA polymerase sigma factor (sigma-70 family)
MSTLETCIPASTDGELLTLWASHKDPRALEALVHRHGGLVYSLCRKLLRSRAEIDDAFQTVFLLLTKHAHQIRRRESVASWLYSVTVRVCKRMAHSQRETTPLPDDLATPMPSSFSQIEFHETSELLARELELLPVKLREPLVLVYLEGHSRSTVAELLNTTEDGIKCRLSRGRKLLRSRLLRRGVTFALAFTASSTTVAEVTTDASVIVPTELLTSTFESCQAGELLAPLSSAPITPSSLDSLTLLNQGAFMTSTTWQTLAITTAVAIVLTIGGNSTIRGNSSSAGGQEVNTEVSEAAMLPETMIASEQTIAPVSQTTSSIQASSASETAVPASSPVSSNPPIQDDSFQPPQPHSPGEEIRSYASKTIYPGTESRKLVDLYIAEKGSTPKIRKIVGGVVVAEFVPLSEKTTSGIRLRADASTHKTIQSHATDKNRLVVVPSGTYEDDAIARIQNNLAQIFALDPLLDSSKRSQESNTTSAQPNSSETEQTSIYHVNTIYPISIPKGEKVDVYIAPKDFSARPEPTLDKVFDGVVATAHQSDSGLVVTALPSANDQIEALKVRENPNPFIVVPHGTPLTNVLTKLLQSGQQPTANAASQPSSPKPYLPRTNTTPESVVSQTPVDAPSSDVSEPGTTSSNTKSSEPEATIVFAGESVFPFNEPNGGKHDIYQVPNNAHSLKDPTPRKVYDGVRVTYHGKTKSLILRAPMSVHQKADTSGENPMIVVPHGMPLARVLATVVQSGTQIAKPPVGLSPTGKPSPLTLGATGSASADSTPETKEPIDHQLEILNLKVEKFRLALAEHIANFTAPADLIEFKIALQEAELARDNYLAGKTLPQVIHEDGLKISSPAPQSLTDVERQRLIKLMDTVSHRKLSIELERDGRSLTKGKDDLDIKNYELEINLLNKKLDDLRAEYQRIDSPDTAQAKTTPYPATPIGSDPNFEESSATLPPFSFDPKPSPPNTTTPPATPDVKLSPSSTQSNEDSFAPPKTKDTPTQSPSSPAIPVQFSSEIPVAIQWKGSELWERVDSKAPLNLTFQPGVKKEFSIRVNNTPNGIRRGVLQFRDDVPKELLAGIGSLQFVLSANDVRLLDMDCPVVSSLVRFERDDEFKGIDTSVRVEFDTVSTTKKNVSPQLLKEMIAGTNTQQNPRFVTFFTVNISGSRPFSDISNIHLPGQIDRSPRSS